MNNVGVFLALLMCAAFGTAALLVVANEHIRRFKQRNSQ